MLEAGAPRFPHDFPTTEPYRERAEAWEASERCQWERKPPAKRVNYGLLGIKNPWKAHWGSVLDGSTPELVGHVPTQRDGIHLWLLNKYLASSVLDEAVDMLDPAAWLFEKLNALRLARGNNRLSPETSANNLWRHALVQVQVELHGRGTLGDVAAIYLLRDDEVQICGRSLEGFREVRLACWLAEVALKSLYSPLNFNIRHKT